MNKYFKDIDKVFVKYADYVQKRVAKNLSWTDNLKNLVKTTPKDEGIEMSMPLYGWVVDKGRGPGAKLPPPEALYGWLEKKSIPLEAAFPIARSIGKRGIVKRPWIDDALNIDQLLKAVASKIVYNMQLEIEQTMNNGEFLKGRIPWNKNQF
jgi:hypothetical protein